MRPKKSRVSALPNSTHQHNEQKSHTGNKCRISELVPPLQYCSINNLQNDIGAGKDGDQPPGKANLFLFKADGHFTVVAHAEKEDDRAADDE